MFKWDNMHWKEMTGRYLPLSRCSSAQRCNTLSFQTTSITLSSSKTDSLLRDLPEKMQQTYTNPLHNLLHTQMKTHKQKHVLSKKKKNYYNYYYQGQIKFQAGTEQAGILDQFTFWEMQWWLEAGMLVITDIKRKYLVNVWTLQLWCKWVISLMIALPLV